MKIRFNLFQFSGVLALILLALFPANSPAQVSDTINIFYYTLPGQATYYIQNNISTSNTILTSYEIISPHTNFETFYSQTNGTFNESLVNITQFDDLITEITNGNWTFITDVGSRAEKTYFFHITATGFTSNDMPQFQITNPTPGEGNVNSNITFTWTGGPTNYTTLDVNAYNDDYDQFESFDPPVADSWTPDPLSGAETNFNFNVNYETSAASFLTISTPMTSDSQALPGWSSSANLILTEAIQFSEYVAPIVASGPHALVAHFTFDDPNNLGVDSSGNGNDYTAGGSQNGASVQGTGDAEIGGGAIQFNRNDSDNSSVAYQGWSPAPPAAILSALAGSFSVSVWVKTSAQIGNDGAPGYDGSAILGADVGGGAFDTVPISLTAGFVAFTTGNGNGNPDDTLTSSQTVNNESYHQIVVTRDQVTGVKSIYIDGQLDSTGVGTTQLLSDPKCVVIGAVTDSGQLFGDSSFYAGYDGEMDDMQIYSGVLNAAEIANLFNNPGTTAPNAIAGGLVAHYTFDDPNNIGQDTSGNGFNLDYDGGDGVTATTNAEAGGSAAFFDGNSFLSYTSTPAKVLNTFAADFTLSFWINTTQNVGNASDPAYFDVCIVSADLPSDRNDLIPAGLSGGVISFNTGGDDEESLNASTNVSNGQFHQVVITRAQATGEKQIYIDGVLNTNDFATTNLLNDPQLVAFGSDIDATQSDPSQANPSLFYNGVMDDVQLYSRVLSPGEIAFLFQHPGSTTAAISANGLVAHYAFDNASNIGQDSSGNGFNLDYNGGNGVTASTNAEAGGGAAFFDGGSFLSYTSTPTNVLSAFASDFALAFWVNTTQNVGGAGDPAYFDVCIVSADLPSDRNDLIPAGLSGGAISFNTGGNDEESLNSTTNVANGQYHQVVITRAQATGQKQIYIDGVLNTSDFATTNLLNDPQLVSFGSDIDATQSDPSQASPSLFFHGTLDDIQLYSRVISSNEVAYLFQHPGSTLNGAVITNPPVVLPPVSVDFQLTAIRSHDPVLGDRFFAFPNFKSISPAPTTTNSVSSPNGAFSAYQSFNSGGSSAFFFGSLDGVINECTNGQWTLTINQGDPSQQVFHFTIAISGLTTNIFGPVAILAPTNSVTGLPVNPPLEWTGPADFSFVTATLDKPDGNTEFSTNLNATATNWTTAPALTFVTNTFQVDYISNNYPNVTFSVPVNATNGPVSSWVTEFDLDSSAFVHFSIVLPPSPVQLVNVGSTNGNFQFSFTSTPGHTNAVQTSTNLASQVWSPYTNITGDGTLKTIIVPANTPAQRYFRIITQ